MEDETSTARPSSGETAALIAKGDALVSRAKKDRRNEMARRRREDAARARWDMLREWPDSVLGLSSRA